MHTSFEELSFPAGMYEWLLQISFVLIGICIVALILVKIFWKNNDTIKNIFMWGCYIPKMLVSLFAILLIFFYDYEAKKWGLVQLDDMIVTTFLVGILAIIEFFSTIATIIKDS